MPLEVNGKSFETDEEGYLANLNDWQPEQWLLLMVQSSVITTGK